MATIREWIETMSKMDTEVLKSMRAALDTLSYWTIFKESYEGLGVFDIIDLIDRELRLRELKNKCKCP